MGSDDQTRGPPKLVSLLRSLHTTVKVKFEHEGVTQTLDSIIGLKQGDLLISWDLAFSPSSWLLS